MKTNGWKLMAAAFILTMLVSGLAGCGGKAEPTATPVPPTPTSVPPTPTPVPPTPTPEPPTPTVVPPTPTPAVKTATYRRDDWGIAFEYPADWNVMQETDDQVILIKEADLTVLLVQFVAEEVPFSPVVFRELLSVFAGPDGEIEIGEATSRIIGGQDAAATRITATVEGIEMTGPIVLVANPETGYSFMYLAWTLDALSEEKQPTFDAIFDSVEFFTPTVSAVEG